jgi:hypothetical protein
MRNKQTTYNLYWLTFSISLTVAFGTGQAPVLGFVQSEELEVKC